jgi:hypothetical protein
MTRLSWADLLIEDVDADTAATLLEPWADLLDDRVALIFLNRFGCCFLKSFSGPVLELDVLSGEISEVAPSYERFVRDVNDRAWHEQHLLSLLVAKLHSFDKIPGPQQCYALAPHPALGGPNPRLGDNIDPRFVTIMDLRTWLWICAQALRLV